MPFTPESIKAHAIPEITQRFTPTDCILYSLSVGIGSDPISPKQLRYVYEDGLVANPMMANVIGYPGLWIQDEAVGADWKRVLHGEQFVELHRPIPVDATVVGRSQVVAVNDRGRDRGVPDCVDCQPQRPSMEPARHPSLADRQRAARIRCV